MGAHHRRTDPGAGAERPAFDEVTHGYDPRQVDDYLATLWRYASQVTSRAAAAESALKAERERSASAGADEQLAAQAGGRIGQMLAIAHQEAEEIINGARVIAESALEEAIEDAGANHPIVREARDQAERLLLDAVEESRRIAAERHLELREEITRSAASLDALRHQQGEIIGAVLRLRAILGSDEVDRAVTDLARAGAAPSAGGDVPGGDVPGRGVPGGGVPGGGVRGGAGGGGVGGGDPAGGRMPGVGAAQDPGSGPAGGGDAPVGSAPPGDGLTRPTAAPAGTPPPAADGWAPADVAGPPGGPSGPAGPAADDPTAGSWQADAGAYGAYGAAPFTPGAYGSADAHGSGDADGGGVGGSAGGSGSAAMRGASGGVYSATTADGASGYGAGAAAAASRAFGARGHGSGTVIGSAGAGGSSLGFGRRPPGRHRQGDVADGEPGAVPPRASVRTADVPFRRGADEEIIDAEIVEE